MRTLVLVVLLTSSVAVADDVVTTDGIIEGVAIDSVFQPIRGASVRIVGAQLVMTLHADGWGNVRVTGLPPARYRIEVERGSFRAPHPVTAGMLVYDRKYMHDCGRPMSYSRSTVPPLGQESPRVGKAPRVINGRSTALGIRLGRREIVGPSTARR